METREIDLLKSRIFDLEKELAGCRAEHHKTKVYPYEEIKTLTAQNAKMREALEFYARNEGLRINHQTNKFESADSDEHDFHGKRARECLAAIGEVGE